MYVLECPVELGGIWVGTCKEATLTGKRPDPGQQWHGRQEEETASWGLTVGARIGLRGCQGDVQVPGLGDCTPTEKGHRWGRD